MKTCDRIPSISLTFLFIISAHVHAELIPGLALRTPEDTCPQGSADEGTSLQRNCCPINEYYFFGNDNTKWPHCCPTLVDCWDDVAKNPGCPDEDWQYWHPGFCCEKGYYGFTSEGVGVGCTPLGAELHDGQSSMYTIAPSTTSADTTNSGQTSGVPGKTSSAGGAVAETSPSNSTGSDDVGPDIGAIVGGAIGGLAGLALIITVGVVIVIKRKRQASDEPNASWDDGAYYQNNTVHDKNINGYEQQPASELPGTQPTELDSQGYVQLKDSRWELP